MATLCTTFLLLGLVLQSRLVDLGSIYLSPTVFVYPISCFIFDIIAEIYGYQYARQTLWSAIIVNIVFALTVCIMISLPFPKFWVHYSTDYDLAMAPIFRTMAFGMLSILIGQFVNIAIISKFRVMLRGKYFPLRSIGSTIIGE